MLNILKYVYLFGSNFKLEIRPVLFIILSQITFFTKAQQNLVPNGSFEEYWECPTAPGSIGNNQLERCKYWYKPTSATSDYYNTCQTDESTGVSIPNNWFGNQQAFEGNAYVGLAIYLPSNKIASEYIQVKLLEPLKSCKIYEVRFWISLADYSAYTTNTIGARLDQTSINNIGGFEAFHLSPHINHTNFIMDTNQWSLLSGLYHAQGGEEYLTIGRFLDSTVSLNNIPNISIQCNYCFQPENAYYYIDSVSVKMKTDEFYIPIPNVFTANSDGVNDYWYPYNICFSNWQCIIVNRWGEIVSTFSSTENGWNGTDSKGNELPEGVYFYSIEEKDNKQTGFIHLVR